MRPASAGMAIVALLGQVAVVHAAVTGRETLFTATCIDAKATGFEWVNGAWQPATHFPSKYTVEKHAPEATLCAELLRQRPSNDAFGDMADACYTITDFGQDPSPFLVCTEWWATGADGTTTLETVSCGGGNSFEWIIFNPTGNFEYARLPGDVTSGVNVDKDPLIVSVGTCRLVGQRGLRSP